MAFQGVQFQIQTTPDEAPWYKQVDPTMTLDKLLKLTEEFSRIYKTHGESLNIKKYAMRSSLRETSTPQNVNQPQLQSPQQPSSQQHRQGQNQVAPSIATLPPPPVAPQLNAAVAVKGAEPTRRIDLSDYKLRNNAAQQQQQPSSSQNSVVQTQRRNFMRPDVLPQTANKGLDLPLPPIIANGKFVYVHFKIYFVNSSVLVYRDIERQLNQNKLDQVIVKPNEARVAQLSKSGALKQMTSQKPVITNVSKPLQSIRQTTLTSEQERHKKPKPDDYDKDLKHRRIEKTITEGSHHRKRPYENIVASNQLDSGSTIEAIPVTNVTSTPKSGTPKAAERHNPVTPLNHMTCGGYNITSRSREETTSQSFKRDNNSTNSSNRGRDESIPSRQRDDVTALKRARQTAPLIALLPTPPVSSAASHYSSSSAGRTKSREPLLSTPDTGNSYYKRSRLRPSSPATATISNTYRQSQRPPSPENRAGSSYSSFTRRYCRGYIYKVTSLQSSSKHRREEWRRRNSWRSRVLCSSYANTSLANASFITSSSIRMLSALPPPPLPPQNEELEDGEVL
ncbi:unnamed protein product [Wuchereria bancrofti]|uniref:Uncharacterized protein n=1 Tax=Wuchereria bancrofti TaxID=6293 RepID=A0A3P7G9K2_WUCBA|nr:unnamed protein product [Wuchereria bancrofti]